MTSARFRTPNGRRKSVVGSLAALPLPQPHANPPPTTTWRNNAAILHCNAIQQDIPQHRTVYLGTSYLSKVKQCCSRPTVHTLPCQLYSVKILKHDSQFALCVFKRKSNFLYAISYSYYFIYLLFSPPKFAALGPDPHGPCLNPALCKGLWYLSQSWWLPKIMLSLI